MNKKDRCKPKPNASYSFTRRKERARANNAAGKWRRLLDDLYGGWEPKTKKIEEILHEPDKYLYPTDKDKKVIEYFQWKFCHPSRYNQDRTLRGFKTFLKKRRHYIYA